MSGRTIDMALASLLDCLFMIVTTAELSQWNKMLEFRSLWLNMAIIT